MTENQNLCKASKTLCMHLRRCQEIRIRRGWVNDDRISIVNYYFKTDGTEQRQISVTGLKSACGAFFSRSTVENLNLWKASKSLCVQLRRSQEIGITNLDLKIVTSAIILAPVPPGCLFTHEKCTLLKNKVHQKMRNIKIFTSAGAELTAINRRKPNVQLL